MVFCEALFDTSASKERKHEGSKVLTISPIIAKMKGKVAKKHNCQ